MSRSYNSSRSTSSSSSGKIPLSIQSDPKQQQTSYSAASYNDGYADSRYTSSTLGEPRSAYSSNSSSGKSSRSSSSDLTPLSISRGSSSQDPRMTNASDQRYYPNSFNGAGPSQKKQLSCQTKERDERYYPNSSYYR